MTETKTAPSPEPAPTPPPSYRLYSPAAVTWASFLGTVVAGGVIMCINYRRLGQNRNAVLAIVYPVIGLVALMVLSEYLPKSIPNVAYLLAPLLCIHQLARQLQGPAYQKHIDAGGPSASNWKATGIGAMFLVLFGGAFAAIIFSSGASFSTMMDLQHSVDMGNNQEVYYTRGATEDMAKRVGKVLVDVGMFNGKSPHSVMIAMEGKTPEFSLTVGPGAWDDEQTVEICKQLARRIAPEVGGPPIILRLLDQNLNEKKHLQVD